MNRYAILRNATAIAAFANTAAATAAERVEPVLTGVGTLTMPVRNSGKRGSESKYPFASLNAVGMAFGVKNKTADKLSGIISNANRKAIKPRLGEDGKQLFGTKEATNAEGAVIQVPDTTKPLTEVTAHYFAYAVTPEYIAANKEAFAKGGTFEGATALIFRDK